MSKRQCTRRLIRITSGHWVCHAHLLAGSQSVKGVEAGWLLLLLLGRRGGSLSRSTECIVIKRVEGGSSRGCHRGWLPRSLNRLGSHAVEDVAQFVVFNGHLHLLNGNLRLGISDSATIRHRLLLLLLSSRLRDHHILHHFHHVLHLGLHLLHHGVVCTALVSSLHLRHPLVQLVHLLGIHHLLLLNSLIWLHRVHARIHSRDVDVVEVLGWLLQVLLRVERVGPRVASHIIIEGVAHGLCHVRVHWLEVGLLLLLLLRLVVVAVEG